MTERWRPPDYDHGELGPLGEETVQTWEYALMHQRYEGHERCSSCLIFWTLHVPEMRVHLKRSMGCWDIRAREFWRRRGCLRMNLNTRFPRLCSNARLEVWRDIRRRLRSDASPKYVVWVPDWADAIWQGYHRATDPRIPVGAGIGWGSKTSVAERKLDTPNDWLMHHTLCIANEDTEFRTAVRGLQRNVSNPWDQRDTLREWIENRGHQRPSDFPTNRP